MQKSTERENLPLLVDNSHGKMGQRLTRAHGSSVVQAVRLSRLPNSGEKFSVIAQQNVPLLLLDGTMVDSAKLHSARLEAVRALL